MFNRIYPERLVALAFGTDTTPTSVDSSIPEKWSSVVLADSLEMSYFDRFAGPEGSGAAIIQKSDLKGPGDLLHIQVTGPLSGAGVSGDTATLEGFEEEMTTTEIKASPLFRRHAVRIIRRANKKSILDLRKEAKGRLAEWGAQVMDEVRFNLLTADALPAPLASEDYNDANVYVVGGGTTDDDIAGTDKLTVVALQQIKLGLRTRNAKPLMIDGRPYFVLVTSPNSLYDLKREAEYRDWVREAEVRGKDNPFFRGATAVIDGIIIHDHPNVPVADNAGSVAVAAALCFGSEAFVEALDEDSVWREQEFDYGNKMGFSYGFAFQPRRALEKNSVRVYVASEAPA